MMTEMNEKIKEFLVTECQNETDFIASMEGIHEFANNPQKPAKFFGSIPLSYLLEGETSDLFMLKVEDRNEVKKEGRLANDLELLLEKIKSYRAADASANAAHPRHDGLKGAHGDEVRLSRQKHALLNKVDLAYYVANVTTETYDRFIQTILDQSNKLFWAMPVFAQDLGIQDVMKPGQTDKVVMENGEKIVGSARELGRNKLASEIEGHLVAYKDLLEVRSVMDVVMRRREALRERYEEFAHGYSFEVKEALANLKM